MVLDVRRRRHGVYQEADVVLAAGALELALSGQLIGQRERIDDTAALGDGHHRPEDPAMTLGVEHRVVNDLDGTHDRVLVDQHRGQDGLLGVFRVRGTPVPVGVTPQGRRRDRVFDGRAGHLPRWGASRQDSAGARRDGRSR